jgi:3-hydroxyacyl-[acyl-carrier-protein] dehydratase
MEGLNQAVRAAAVEAPHATGAGCAAGRYRFDPDFAGFSGHFPERPLLPAVVEIMAALQVAGEAWGDPGSDVLFVEKAKFLRPVAPGEEVEVRCERKPFGQGTGVEAKVFAGDELAASFFVATGPGTERP